MKQTNPPASWLQNVRKDLVEEYTALHQPEKAAKVRALLAGMGDEALDASRK